jgi:hypothetical protein
MYSSDKIQIVAVEPSYRFPGGSGKLTGKGGYLRMGKMASAQYQSMSTTQAMLETRREFRLIGII